MQELPPGLAQEKNYASFAKQFATALYQNKTFSIYQTNNPKMTSKPGESEGDFRVRISHEMRENRDDLVKKLREKYAAKIAAISEKVQRAQEKMAQKQQKASDQKAQTMISFGTTLVGALFGKGITKGTINQTGTSLRRATQISKDSQDAAQAEDDLKTYQQQLQDLEAQMNNEISAMVGTDANIQVETTTIRPKKTDINVEKIALVWWAS